MNNILALTVLVLAGFASSQVPEPTPQKVPVEPKIINGEDAKKNELPYQVQLKRFNRPRCGGSIINENYILTAGHCVNGTDKSRFTVIAGEHDISSPTNDGTEQSRTVAEIIIHEKLKEIPTGYKYDIALLKLSSPLKFNYAVKPIPLPQQGHLATGRALASGWGSISPNITSPNFPTILQKVFLPITPMDVCKRKWGEYITEDMICAGPILGEFPEHGTCVGDSGGPLVASDNGTYLAGVASWVPVPCALKYYPSVYADVSYFLTWINEKMGIVPPGQPGPGAGQVVFLDFVRVKQVLALSS